MILLAERSATANNEPTPEDPLPREMTPRRASFLMIATLLLLCGSMLLFLDLAANASGTHGQVAMIGLVLVAIGGSCLWADFFEVTSWFARERWVTGHVPRIHEVPKVLHKRGASAEENSQAPVGDAEENHVQEELAPREVSQ